jgi:hypothetical protein
MLEQPYYFCQGSFYGWFRTVGIPRHISTVVLQQSRIVLQAELSACRADNSRLVWG